MDLSKLSDSDLEAVSAKKWDQVSDEGLNYLSQQKQQQPGPLETFLRNGVGAITAARNGIVKGATFGTVDPDKMVDKKLQDMSEGHVQGGLEQNSQEHPLASAAGQAAGAGGTVAAGGMGLEALIPGILGKTAAAGGTVAKTAAQAAPVIAALKYMLHK